MIDPFGRKVTYLRLSVTDRCDFRCTYCMAEDMTFLPRKDLLTLEELDQVCSSFIDLGVEKLRITGGEPLMRRGLMDLLQGLRRYLDGGQLKELTLTTNGSQLHRFAHELVDVGVKRINVSLDTLNPETFKALTRRGDFDQVMQGIMTAKAAGLQIKINAVALKGMNDHEIHPLIQWCGDQGFDLTFIETMPMGEIAEGRLDSFYPLVELRDHIAERWTLAESDYRTGGPARYSSVEETGGRIGFISPLTHNFCESCNRVRLTCTGMLYLCLGQDDSKDLRQVIRDQGPEALTAAIEEAIGRKPKGHDFIIDREGDKGVNRHMSMTGG